MRIDPPLPISPLPIAERRPGGAASIEVLSEPTELPMLAPASAEDVFGSVRADPVKLDVLPPATAVEVFGEAPRTDAPPLLFASPVDAPLSMPDADPVSLAPADLFDPPTVYDLHAIVHRVRR